MLAAGAVHTTGINWISLLTLIVSFCLAIGAGVGFISRRADQNRTKTQEFIQLQVHTVTDSLAGRLDRVDAHLADQDKTVSLQNERLARVEGRLLIPTQAAGD